MAQSDRTIFEGNFCGTDVRHQSEIEKRYEALRVAVLSLACGVRDIIGDDGVNAICRILKERQNEKRS